MRRRKTISARAVRVALSLLAASSLGCFAYGHGDTHVTETPIVNTGVGASIIYPGQQLPVYAPSIGRPASPPATATPPQGTPAAGTPTAAPQSVAPPSYGGATTTRSGPNGEQRSGAPATAASPITMIGGAEQDIDVRESWKQEPLWWKYMALPFAVVTAPFKYAAEALRGDPDPGPALPKAAPEVPGAAPPSQPPPPPREDYETARMNELERELEKRQATAPPPRRTPAGPRVSGRSPISDELVALQRGAGAHRIARPPARTEPPRGDSGGATGARVAPPPPPEPARPAMPTPRARVADGIVDRDGDGRVDQWIYRSNGEISRIELDENGDGHVDRTILYDLGTHQIRRVEEDANGDGASDSWTDYSAGRVSRRRGDSDYDGIVDTWSFYRDGQIMRHEQDTTGNGFRDRTGYYDGGKLVREERDSNGDGRWDTLIHYDAGERVERREEDRDGDGRPDVISYFEAGRLSRRELLDNDRSPENARP